MEGGNGMPGAGGMLRLDMLIHPQPPSRRHQILPFSTAQPQQQQQQKMSHHPCPSYSYGGSGDKQLPLLPSPEDESGFGKEGVGAAATDGVNHVSPSPWQRMKWTDSMVRLLIMAVYRMGDDGAGTEGDQQPQTAKGKKSSIQQQQQQQQKGKWKSVSRAMVDKGFYVSPQQCEDKFNDLNKRYKRVNDLLGKGTACRVVENQSLLDSMDHLSTKAKDEARKLLNSKHLFFREMCAYHNGGAAAAPPPPPPPPSDQSQQQPCFHHPLETATSLGSGCGALGRAEEEQGHDDGDDDMDSEDDEVDDYDDVNDDDDDDDDDDSEGVNEDNDDDRRHRHRHRHRHRQQQQQSKHEEEGYEDEDSKGFTTSSSCLGAKRRLRGTNMTASRSLPLSLSLGSPPAISIQKLRNELTELAGRGEEQQRQWLKRKAAELEEQRVGYQCQALQLERQRFKWLRYSSNKEREMERTKLDNDRLRLQNERMLLLLRRKELQLTTPQFPQQQPNANKDYQTTAL